MNQRRTKFLPPIRHALDLRGQRMMRDAVNSILNGKVVVGSAPRLHYSDSNMVIEVPNVGAPTPAAADTDFPFRIHKPDTIGNGVAQLAENTVCKDYAVGDILTVDGGVVAAGGSATTLRVDSIYFLPHGYFTQAAILNAGLYSTPPPSPQTATGGAGVGATFSIPLMQSGANYTCAIDPARVVGVSSGLIGTRSKFIVPFLPNGNDQPRSGNWESYILMGTKDTEQDQITLATSPTGVVGIGDQDLDLSAFVTGISSPYLSMQIHINKTPFAGGGSSVNCISIWAKINDPPRILTYQDDANLVVRGLLVVGTNQLQFFPDPATEDYVPIGYFLTNTDITQIQYGNCVNRYPPGANIERGRWTADALTGQVFYNFDTVVDDSTILFSTGGKDFYGVYQYSNGCGAEATSPANTLAHWKLYSIIVL